MMYKLFNPQSESAFFSAPTEIRHAIYAYLLPEHIHLSLREEKFRFSPCVQLDEDDDPDCFTRRTNDANIFTNPRASDPIYALRLTSSWDSHWRCEEAATRTQTDYGIDCNSIATALFLTCKRMLIEFAETTADLVVIHVNDIFSLDLVVSNALSHAPGSDRFVTSTLLSYILPNLKALSISMRLPRAAFTAHEAASISTSSLPSLIYTFNKIPLAIGYMSKLRRLRICLDHDEPCTWSVVDERATLSPLAPLGNLPRLDVTINLPKLHPKWESPDKHFTDDSALPPLVIHRRYRQRYHGIESRDGAILVKYAPDFPILYELAEPGESMEELESMERRKWKAGEDPLDDIRAFEPACDIWF
ncbi:hypothetical protein BKA66DRAFT_477783 [Pyrenochaeta sp. MPI-SDFR-AT-0127]|nr:hypothetical protein BKA66DRAFT_477783 [Pyrenochaeta sp. MPI-SDFR-AT-0127]